MKKKEKKPNYTALQLLFAVILMGLGYLLSLNEEATAPLAFLFVPGAVLVINTIMNFFTYKRSWYFPAITNVLCDIGMVIVCVVQKINVGWQIVVGLAICSIAVTIMGTLFHLLHADIIINK